MGLQILRGAPMRWAALALSLVVVLAVLAAPGARHSGPIAHPSGARDIIAQLSSGGGMAPRLEALASSFPALTLYGDGTLIYHAAGGYHQARLDEAAIQRLLHSAVDDVQFFDLPASLANPEVYDAPGTSVSLQAAGRTHNVSAQALGFADHPPDSPPGRLVRFVHTLGALMDDHAPAYMPATAHLYAETSGSGSTGPATVAWPVPGVDLASVVAAGASPDGLGFRVDGPTAAAVLRAASTPAPYTQGGRFYRVLAVPDLP